MLSQLDDLDRNSSGGKVPDHNADTHGKTSKQTAKFLLPASQNWNSKYSYY